MSHLSTSFISTHEVAVLEFHKFLRAHILADILVLSGNALAIGGALPRFSQRSGIDGR